VASRRVAAPCLSDSGRSGEGTVSSTVKTREWKFGKLANGGIRICEECGDVSTEDEMHACPGTREERERMDQVELYEPQNISQEDLSEYMSVIDSALRIHDDREKKRKGLWKKYPALAQLNQAKIKIERCIHLLEYTTPEDDFTETATEIESECYDIINYANFAARRARDEAIAQARDKS